MQDATPADSNPFRLVTVEEAAQLMSVSKRQIERMIRDGDVPTWRPSPRVVRVPWWAVVQRISRECGVDPAITVAPPAAKH